MRIEVNKITDREIHLTEDIPASNWDMDSFDVKFIDQVHLECSFLRLGNEILIDGNVSVARLINCSRCLRNVKEKVKKDFILSYDSKTLGEHLEVDSDVREELLLNFPMKPLCVSDCKGICPNCGKNLNLGDCNCKKSAGIKLPLGIDIKIKKKKQSKKAKTVKKEKTQKFKIKVVSSKFSFKKKRICRDKAKPCPIQK